MRLSQVFTLAVLPTATCRWSPFAFSSQTPLGMNDVPEPTGLTVEFNPSELLKSRIPKPEVYQKAMLELKRLEEEPICHRMAARLLMSNCQGLENISEQDYKLTSASIERHHVESFAASLAMCDMERARFDIPGACTPFRSSALHKAIRGNGILLVSPEQVSACLEALGQDHSHWMTWLSYRDKALLFCRGARVDIDKDQSILLHKELTRIMTEFTNGLYEDLKDINEGVADHKRAMDSYFETFRNQAESWKAKFQETFDSISDEVKDVNSAVKSIVNSSNDAYRMMRNLVSTMIQSNAEMAAEQEHALVITTNGFQTRMGVVNELVTEAAVSLGNMKDRMGLMFTVISAMSERQSAMDETSRNTLDALINATEILQSHTQKLNKASLTASGIRDNLERAAASAFNLNSWDTVIDWIIRIVLPLLTMVIGNYGTDPTIVNNLLLFSGGLLVAEIIILAHHHDWNLGSDLSDVWRYFSRTSKESEAPQTSSFSQQLREWKDGVSQVTMVAEILPSLIPTISKFESNIYPEMV